MKKDLLNIISGEEETIDYQKLTDYVSGNLSGPERDAIEKQLDDNNFVKDALEGLEQIKDKNTIPASIEQLNILLAKQLKNKKRIRERIKLKEYPWIYLSIILILILCVVGYLIVQKLLQLHHP